MTTLSTEYQRERMRDARLIADLRAHMRHRRLWRLARMAASCALILALAWWWR